MNAGASPVTGEPVLVPTLHTDLAPPFSTEWTRLTAPAPRGYTAGAQLVDGTGEGTLTLKARSHPPDAPTTIGWYWAGWERRVNVQLATAFQVAVHCRSFKHRGGGICVPRCFLTLRPVGGGTEFFESVVLVPRPDGEAWQWLSVVVPQSPILPAAVPYILKVNFNLRAVYSKTQNPDATLEATIKLVQRSFAFPTAADDSARAEAADGAPADAELDPVELATALAALGGNGQGPAVESDR